MVLSLRSLLPALNRVYGVLQLDWADCPPDRYTPYETSHLTYSQAREFVLPSTQSLGPELGCLPATPPHKSGMAPLHRPIPSTRLGSSRPRLCSNICQRGNESLPS